jgi:hypothetical protein
LFVLCSPNRAGEIELIDKETSIPGIKTIFKDKPALVSVSGIEWEASETPTSTLTLNWVTLVDGEIVTSGSVDLDSTSRELLTSIDAGEIIISDRGRSTVEVRLQVDNSSASTTAEFQVFGAGAAIAPLLIILFLAMTTKMVSELLLEICTEGYLLSLSYRWSFRFSQASLWVPA